MQQSLSRGPPEVVSERQLQGASETQPKVQSEEAPAMLIGRFDERRPALLLTILTALIITLSASPLATIVTAHSANTFIIIVKSDSMAPAAAVITLNDSVMWYNVDHRENVTHRIVYDADGDGLYNGTGEWDSGILEDECELDAQGNKTDEECEVTFLLAFNESSDIGYYAYQDLLSDGTTINSTLCVWADNHSQDGEHAAGDEHSAETHSSAEQEHNSCTASGESEAGSGTGTGTEGPQQESSNSPQSLDMANAALWIAAMSGVLALALFALMFLNRVRGESDSGINMDAEDNYSRKDNANRDEEAVDEAATPTDAAQADSLVE
jgi:hypothetical protein